MGTKTYKCHIFPQKIDIFSRFFNSGRERWGLGVVSVREFKEFKEFKGFNALPVFPVFLVLPVL